MSSSPKTKTRLFLLVFLPCLIGSAWAGSLPVDLTMSDALMENFKGSLIWTPDSTPFGPRVMPLAPAAKPGPTPLGPPITQPGNRPHPCVTCGVTTPQFGKR